RSQVCHEVEQHEAGENQNGLKASTDVNRDRSQQKADRAADEADNLQTNAAKLVGEQNGKANTNNQERGDHGRSSGGKDIVSDQVAQAAYMISLFAECGGQDGGGK